MLFPCVNYIPYSTFVHAFALKILDTKNTVTLQFAVVNSPRQSGHQRIHVLQLVVSVKYDPDSLRSLWHGRRSEIYILVSEKCVQVQ